MIQTEATETSIISTRQYSVPRDLVFASWTEPERIAEWWGPVGFTTTVHSMDVSPGGKWRFTMHGPDAQEFTGTVRYIAIDRPSRLTYEHLDDAGQPMFPVVVTF